MEEKTWTRGHKHSYTDEPLTNEEKRFAEEHHSCLFYYMRERHLNSEEWYDILVIPYLEAVKKYFNYEPCKAYAFPTVLNKKLDTAVCNYWRATNRKKRMPESGFVSLDYMVEGDNPFAEYTPSKLNQILVDNKQAVEQIVLDTVMIQEIMESLTEQQQTIFRLMLEGYSKLEIIKALSINYKTINIELDSVKDSVKRCISQ
jgi:DNA-directed RNA polymerase specialized sigma24 family protein